MPAAAIRLALTLLGSASTAAGAYGTIFSIRRGARLDIYAGTGTSRAFHLTGDEVSRFASVAVGLNVGVGPTDGVTITPHVLSSSHAGLQSPHGTVFVADSSSYFGITGFLNQDTVRYQNGLVASLDFDQPADAAAALIDWGSSKTTIESGDNDLITWSSAQGGPTTVVLAPSTVDRPGEIRIIAGAGAATLIQYALLEIEQAPSFFSTPAMGDSMLRGRSGGTVRVSAYLYILCI